MASVSSTRNEEPNFVDQWQLQYDSDRKAEVQSSKTIVRMLFLKLPCIFTVFDTLLCFCVVLFIAVIFLSAFCHFGFMCLWSSLGGGAMGLWQRDSEQAGRDWSSGQGKLRAKTKTQSHKFTLPDHHRHSSNPPFKLPEMGVVTKKIDSL